MLALIFGYLELDRTSVAPYHANTRHLQVVEWESLMLKQYDPARVQNPVILHMLMEILSDSVNKSPLAISSWRTRPRITCISQTRLSIHQAGPIIKYLGTSSRCLIGCSRRHAYMSSSSFTRTTAGAGRVVMRDISHGSVSRTERQEICPWLWLKGRHRVL